jgi:nicotinate-nucleotide adenylyltransferase
LAVAQAAGKAGYDEVVLLPAACSPHKREVPPAPAWDRFAMCVVATLADPRTAVSRHELDRPPPSYSVDTVTAFRRRRPEADFWWALGADNLAALPSWAHLEDLTGQARFLVFPRGSLRDDALRKTVAALPGGLAGAVDILDMPPVDISSSRVREILRAGGDPSRYVPAGVSRYIARYRLYQGTPIWHT